MLRSLQFQERKVCRTESALRGIYERTGLAFLVRNLIVADRFRKKGNIFWGFVFPALWPLTSGLLRFLSSIQEGGTLVRRELGRDAVMLVADSAAKVHWPDDSPDLTDRFGRWITESHGVRSIQYSSTLREFQSLPLGTLVVANYDWLSNLMAGKNPFATLIREALAARRLNTRVWCPLVDVFGIRYSTYASILVVASQGANVICQNSPEEAEAYGLPRVVGPHLWQWPPSELKIWAGSSAWEDRQGAAVAFSGDSRRADFFPPLVKKLEEAGIPVKKSSKNLSFEDYVWQSKTVRLVATTCWLQPFYLVGPDFYSRRLPPGHITNRVWEALASGAALLTNDTPAIRWFGLYPGVHFVAIPELYQSWDSWTLPDDSSLRMIAERGNSRFRAIVTKADLD